jgi:leader peptidase (prepilin peptidase)/N-methyltransferase
MLMVLVYLYIFVLGAIAGSFITAWVWRVREDKSMLDKHSECPHCHHPLGPRDLIPLLSWLWQRGRCRYCQAQISAQYPVVEFSTALIFVVIAYRIVSLLSPALSGTEGAPYALLQPWPITCLIFSWVIAVLLIALFVYDLHWYELPDIWTLGGAALALLMTVAAAAFQQPMLWQPTAEPISGIQGSVFSILSGIIAWALFMGIIWGATKILHKQGMGEGDAKLALLMGLFLGFPAIIVAVYLAFVLGAVLSLFLIAGKRKSWGQSLPFGPFLIVGTFVALFIAPQVVSWYLELLV